MLISDENGYEMKCKFDVQCQKAILGINAAFCCWHAYGLELNPVTPNNCKGKKNWSQTHVRTVSWSLTFLHVSDNYPGRTVEVFSRRQERKKPAVTCSLGDWFAASGVLSYVTCLCSRNQCVDGVMNDWRFTTLLYYMPSASLKLLGNQSSSRQTLNELRYTAYLTRSC